MYLLGFSSSLLLCRWSVAFGVRDRVGWDSIGFFCFFYLLWAWSGGSMVGFPVLVSLLSSSTDFTISNPSREGKGLTALVGIPNPVSCSWLFFLFFFSSVITRPSIHIYLSHLGRQHPTLNKPLPSSKRLSRTLAETARPNNPLVQFTKIIDPSRHNLCPHRLPHRHTTSPRQAAM